MRTLILTLALGLTPFLHAETKSPAPKPKAHDFKKWEKDVAAFEAGDAVSPPPKGAVLFVGSSTIVRWKTLAKDFKGTTVLNRGFGGNQIVDSTHFAERMIFPYEPRMIILRAGGNDINAGKKAEQVFQDYKDFVAKMRTKLPDIDIVYLGLSPTIKRWAQVEEGNKLNDLIAAQCQTQPHLKYIDCKTLTLDAEGKPRPELMVADKLHFSAAGYKLLVEKVRPFLSKE
jgi:hypothetical protein